MKKCITPHWGSSTHDVIFEKICFELNLQNVHLNLCKIEHPFSILQAGTLFLFLLPNICKCFFRKDIRKLKLFSTNIGHSINETSVATSKLARFSFNFFGFKVIFDSLFAYIRIIREFKSGQIALILGGDEAYIPYSLLAQLAKSYKIPSYFLRGQLKISANAFDQIFLTASPQFEKFPPLTFEQITDAEFLETQKILDRRVLGDKTSLFYMNPSNPEFISTNTLASNAFWIYLHDFYDSPGVNGDNLFPSHYDWLEFCVEFMLNLNAVVCIKRHPNERSKNSCIIMHFKNKWGNRVFWQDLDIPLVLVAKSDPKAILTVHGTVIPEATYAGIPIISAGRSRYEGFDISHRAYSKEHLQRLLQLANIYRLSRKDKRQAVLAEFSNRRYPAASEIDFGIPFNDISKETWNDLNLGEFPPSNHLRRQVFLTSKTVESYMKSKVSEINLSNSLNISPN